jgi:PKD repeat protein
MKPRYVHVPVVLLLLLLPVVAGETPSIRLAPNTTFPGGDVTILGDGLPSKQSYILRIDGAYFSSGVTLLNGTLNRQLTVPRTLSLGNHTMNLTSNGVTTATNFTVVQWPVSLETLPDLIRPGTMVYFHGQGYPPNAAYSVYLDEEKVASGPTDSTGSFTKEYLLPKTISLGPHGISASATQHFGPPTANATMNVVQWEIAVDVDPPIANAGRRIAITGSGLPPFALFDLLLDGSLLVSGQADLEGYLERTHTLAKTIPLGPHEVVVRATEYTGEPEGNFTFQVVQWPVQFWVDPISARSGEAVSFEGLGYPPGADIRIFLDDQLVRSGTADVDGDFQIAYVLPKTLTTGVHDLDARAPQYSGPPSASSTITIEPWTPAISVTPLAPHPGQTVAVNGSRFPPTATLNLYLDSDPILTLKADSDGEFLAEIPLQRQIELGDHELKASAVNYAGPPTSTATLRVTQWPLAIFTNTTNLTKGAALEINGTGFPPSTGIRVHWDGSYIKAGSTDNDGRLHLQLIINFDDDQSYHLLALNVTDTYRGPPSVFMYLWLGTDPPEARIHALDSTLAARTDYYHDEEICVNGSGFPPLRGMRVAVVDGAPSMGSAIDPIAHVNLQTDSQGRLPASLLWQADRHGVFSIIADLNSNMILDNSDLLAAGALRLAPRPDVAVLEIVPDTSSPVQGQSVEVTIVVANQGGSSADLDISLLVGAQPSWTLQVPGLEPGENATVVASVDTAALAVGTNTLAARVGTLPDETDVVDNALQVDLDVLSRPDIEVRSVLPDQETYRIGDVLLVSVVVRNGGERPESFDVSLLVDDAQVDSDRVTMLQPGVDYLVDLSWDTSGATPGNLTLAAAAQVLPFEEDAADNQLTYGTIGLLPPNQNPAADAGGPYNGQMGRAVSFDGSGSYDTDGQIVSFSWDFGDGQTGSGVKTSHAYGETGIYDVTLTVEDDSGGVDVDRTTCIVTDILYILEVSVIDSPTGTPLRGSTVGVDGRNYSVPHGQVIVTGLESGSHAVMAFKDGYEAGSVDITIEGNFSLSIALDPVCTIETTDSTGAERSSFSSEEPVFVSVVSPGNYYGRIYVVAPGGLGNGSALQDVTGLGFVSSQFVPGTTLVAAWQQNLQDGSFRTVLDLDGDGVLNLAYDRVSGRFTIPEIGLIALMVLLAASAFGASKRSA